jgi:hypothetical protein
MVWISPETLKLFHESFNLSNNFGCSRKDTRSPHRGNLCLIIVRTSEEVRGVPPKEGRGMVNSPPMEEIWSFQKRSILPPQRKFLPSGGGGEKKLFLIIVNVLGHPKGVGGLTSYFLRGVVWMFSGMTYWMFPGIIHTMTFV